MRDILADVDRWQRDGKRIALATVIATWGSAPRGPGSRMAVTADGDMAGSVSGGCVEAAVIQAGIEALKSSQPRLLHFSVADDMAWQVGLACGGSIDIFVNPLDYEFFRQVRAGLSETEALALATVVRGRAGILGRELMLRHGGQTTGTLGAQWDAPALMLATEALAGAIPGCHRLGADLEIFLDVILPPPTLVVVGGAHITLALMTLARTLGYKTILIDPRKAWGNSGRFGAVDRLIEAWPEQAFQEVELTRRTAILALTHDPKLDDPSLLVALQSPAFYVGALGSRRTQADRRARLLASGLTAAQVARLHTPIGLAIGAETPEEIGLAVMAEVVSTLHRQNDQQPQSQSTIADAI